MIKDGKPGGFGIFCDQGIHIDLLGIYSRKSSACITGVILSSAKHETLTSAQLAHLEECWSAERRAVSSNLGRTTNH